MNDERCTRKTKYAESVKRLTVDTDIGTKRSVRIWWKTWTHAYKNAWEWTCPSSLSLRVAFSWHANACKTQGCLHPYPSADTCLMLKTLFHTCFSNWCPPLFPSFFYFLFYLICLFRPYPYFIQQASILFLEAESIPRSKSCQPILFGFGKEPSSTPCSESKCCEFSCFRPLILSIFLMHALYKYIIYTYCKL